MNSTPKIFYGLLSVLIIATACILSIFWHVPYIFTLIGFSAWAFFGHLVTADDDSPNGWSNPDGKRPTPWRAIAIKAIVFAVFCTIAFFSPMVRSLGA